MTGTLASIFGQHTTGLVFGLHLPKWFIEGDAVYSETVWSNSGRGRDPMFRMKSKAWASSLQKKSYNQLLFGSYSNYSPGAYNFGYEMVTLGRQIAGVALWDSSTRFVARRPWQPFAFSAALKRQTGLTTRSLFDKTLSSLKVDSCNRADFLPKSTVTIYEDFIKPRLIQGQVIVAIHEKFGERADIVAFDSSSMIPYTLLKPGNIASESFDAKGQWLVWTEQEPHIRWEHQQFSVVWAFHTSGKKAFRLRAKTRWFLPILSPDVNRLAVIEIGPNGRESLVILSFPEGMFLQRMDVPSGVHLMSPVWFGDSGIIFLRLDESGKTLVAYDIESQQQRLLYDFKFRYVLSSAVIAGTPVVTTELNGEAVLAAVTPSGLRLVSAEGFGVNDASGDSTGKWLHTVYTPEGYRIVTHDCFTPGILIEKTSNWRKEDDFATQEMQLPLRIVQADTSIPGTTDYSRLSHLFRFHSLAPAAYDVTSQEAVPGITLLSQNTTGTAVTSLGYRYLNSIGNHELFGTFDFYGLYPVIGAEATIARRQTIFINDEGRNELNWTQTTAEIRTYIPLLFSHGNHNYGLTPQFSFKGEWYRMDDGSAFSFSNDTYQSLNLSLQLYHTNKSSVNDPYPRWGQILYGLYRQSPFGGASLGKMIAGEGIFYFPGFMPHHGFRLYTGYEQQPAGMSYYGYVVDFPRGSNSYRLPNRAAGGITYAFPILRPDWDFGKLAYIQRLNGKVFYDANLGWHSHLNHYSSSFGLELTADCHLLRLIPPVNTGIRVSWLPDNQLFSVEWLMVVRFDAI
ncbi:MAG: hypothetical protein CVU06_09005 [Bacteroidetes bacterium HGW-Bacteroidetes-22]|nr:MAG: hypothetical protein CVU06_09005 [Bacteroidetes bacterium HGW-Bacteroidetes-22]